MNLLTVILYLVIVLVILLAIKYFYCNEEFTEVHTTKTLANIVDGEKFKLTTVVGGVKYYVIVSNMGNCKVYEDDTACNKFNKKPSNKQKLDCNLDGKGHTLSLISEDDYKKLMEEQEKNVLKEKISCETNYKVDCEHEHKKANQEVQQEAKCEVPENYCKTEKYDPTLFVIVKTIVKNEEGKDIEIKKLIGFTLEDKKITPYAININKFPGNHKTICVNAYFDIKAKDEYTNISFEEIADKEPAYYLKMVVPAYLPCPSNNKYFVLNNSAKTVDYYFGISQKDNSNNYNLTCDKNPRIEVYKNPPNLDLGEVDKKHLWLKFNIE